MTMKCGKTGLWQSVNTRSRSRMGGILGVRIHQYPQPIRRRREPSTAMGARDQARTLCYASEARVIAGASAQWGQKGLETGGILSGLYNEQGHSVILLATGPGPGAVHEAAFFRHDRDFLIRIEQCLREHFGLSWIGDWHCHHGLGLKEPSSTDVNQVRSVARKLGSRQRTSIITTLERQPASETHGLHQRDPAHAMDCKRVRINTFTFSNPAECQYGPAQLNVLPGYSPIRLALLASGLLTPEALGEAYTSFLLEDLVYDGAEYTTGSVVQEKVLRAVEKQLTELPQAAQKQVHIEARPDALTLEIALSGEATARFCVETGKPDRISSIEVLRAVDGVFRSICNPICLTGKRTRLAAAYADLMDQVTGAPLCADIRFDTGMRRSPVSGLNGLHTTSEHSIAAKHGCEPIGQRQCNSEQAT